MRITEIRPMKADYILGHLEPGILYILPSEAAVHLCACGCGLGLQFGPKHKLTVTGSGQNKQCSVDGSISVPTCGSHYYIEQNRIRWVNNQ